MFSRICAFLTALTCVLVLLAGCGDDKNAPIVGRWQATKVKLNGETISFAELDCSDKEFSFNFKEDGSCRAVSISSTAARPKSSATTAAC